MSKTLEELEFKAGCIIGELQKEGYMPKNVSEICIIALTYIIERHSTNREKALEAVIAALKGNVILNAN